MAKKKRSAHSSSHIDKIIEPDKSQQFEGVQRRSVNILEEYAIGVQKINALKDVPSLLRESKQWLAKANNIQSSSSELSAASMFFYASAACKAADKAYDYEKQAIARTDKFHIQSFEVFLQKIRAHSIFFIAAEKRKVEELLETPADRDRLHHSLFPSEDMMMHNAVLSIQLLDIVKIVFDIEIYKLSFGSDIFPKERLGKGIFENKERYAAKMMDEFKKIIKHISMSRNSELFLNEVMICIRQVTNETLAVARNYGNRSYGDVAALVNKTLFRVVADVHTCHVLKELGMFSIANKSKKRLGGAEEQKYEVDIHDLIVAYKG
jgi:hypothetical protein